MWSNLYWSPTYQPTRQKKHNPPAPDTSFFRPPNPTPLSTLHNSSEASGTSEPLSQDRRSASNPKKAIISVARKLAALLHRLWVRNKLIQCHFVFIWVCSLWRSIGGGFQGRFGGEAVHARTSEKSPFIVFACRLQHLASGFDRPLRQPWRRSAVRSPRSRQKESNPNDD